MAVVLQIGAGGVGGVVAHKMAMNRETFSRIILASRTLSKCKAIADSIRAKGLGEIECESVNADSVEELVALIKRFNPTLVVNVALPYQDLSIMEACLRTKTHYLDTANYEHPDNAHFEYKEQWAYDKRFKEAGIFGLLGSGFDPGVTNVFCAYAQKHYFDEIYSIDILDCNAGDHGYAFATNFNPEINLREVSSKARYWVSHSACSESCRSAPDASLQRMSDTSQPSLENSSFQVLKSAAMTQALDSTLQDNTPHSPSLHNSQDSSTILGGEFGQNGDFTPQPANLTQDTRIAECGDSSSKSQNVDSKNLVSQTDLNLNPDLQQDTIYRKFERKERHWEQEVAEKERIRLAKERGNSKILDEKSQLQSCKCGDKTGASIAQMSDKPSNLSLKAEFSYCGGQWRDIAPLALMKEWDYPEVGVKNSYLLYHEELESLIRNIRGLKRIRFFMTFGESYLTHMKCLENIGLLRVDEVSHQGQSIVPIQVLKTLLPDPASLAPRTKGKTNIGCYIRGVKGGKERTIYIYNVCEHEKCFDEVNAQGVSYTTGVPAMIGAKLICEGKWGVGARKNVSLTHSLQELEKSSIDRHTALLDFSAQASNLKQDIHSLDTHLTQDSSSPQSSEQLGQNLHSLDSNDSRAESFNAKRLELNKDMPQGGEYQGIDNATELQKLAQNNIESSKKESQDSKILGGNAEVKEAERNSKILDEKSGLQKNNAQAVEMRNCDFKAGGERSLASLNAQSKCEQSAIYRSTQGAGVWNMEQNDPDFFMKELNKQGLPYVVLEIESSKEVRVLEDGRK